MTKVIIASNNPVKVNCVKKAFNAAFISEKFEFEGVNASSEVSDQPMSDEETINGAINRVKNAQLASPHSDYWVGIEGGISQNNSEMAAFAWIVIRSNKKVGKAKTAMFYLPSKIAKLVNQGIELGKADDMIFKKDNSKQKEGAIGILTNGLINREIYYEQAVIMALIPFINDELYL